MLFALNIPIGGPSTRKPPAPEKLPPPFIINPRETLPPRVYNSFVTLYLFRYVRRRRRRRRGWFGGMNRTGERPGATQTDVGRRQASIYAAAGPGGAPGLRNAYPRTSVPDPEFSRPRPKGRARAGGWVFRRGRFLARRAL